MSNRYHLNEDEQRSVDKKWLKACGVDTAGEYGETDLGFRGGQLWQGPGCHRDVLMLGHNCWVFVSAHWNKGGMTCTWFKDEDGGWTDRANEADLLGMLKKGWKVVGTAYEECMSPWERVVELEKRLGELGG